MQRSGGTGNDANAAAIPHGGVSELLRIGGRAGSAALSVLCGREDEAAVVNIAVGDFVLVAVTKPATGLVLIECSVQEHRWLLAPDSAVIRVGPRKFTFSFPGFFYALSLPDGSFDHEINSLELFLHGLCYQDHAGRRDSDFSPRREGSDFWVSAYAKITALSSALLPQPAPIVDLSMAVQTAKKSSIAARIALLVLKHMHRPSPYITIAGSISSAVSASVFPSICVLSDVMEVIDSSSLLRSARGGGAQLSPAGRWSQLASLKTASWSFNAIGLVIVLQAVSASRAMANRALSASH